LLNNDDLRTHTIKYKNKFFTEWKNWIFFYIKISIKLYLFL
jgi:hypothetical protein